jgi:hypothetical protein
MCAAVTLAVTIDGDIKDRAHSMPHVHTAVEM